MTRFSRFAALTSLGMVTLAFAVAVWRPLATFPVDSLRFWADDGVVALSVALLGLATVGAWRGSLPLLAVCVAAPAGAFVGAAGVCFVCFTASPSVPGLLLLAAGLWLLGSRRFVFQTPVAVVGLTLGALGGALHLGARRPPVAATHPAGGTVPASADTSLRLDFPCGPATLSIAPALTFESATIDGFWAGLSRPDPLTEAPRLDGPAQRAAISHGATTVDAVTEVPREVRSHLNTFTNLVLHDVARPRLRFEALQATFDLLPYDYPRGRPAQFAYVTGRTLVVARGHDAEKGPFEELGRGPIGEALSLTFFDGERALCTVRFDDFVRQADVTTVSPTAGEGVTVNVVQFGIPAQGPGLPWVHLSLAETGIGAGLETVRHAPGVYVNHLEVTSPR